MKRTLDNCRKEHGGDRRILKEIDWAPKEDGLGGTERELQHFRMKRQIDFGGKNPIGQSIGQHEPVGQSFEAQPKDLFYLVNPTANKENTKISLETEVEQHGSWNSIGNGNASSTGKQNPPCKSRSNKTSSKAIRIKSQLGDYSSLYGPDANLSIPANNHTPNGPNHYHTGTGRRAR
jgi:hypothetical protein